MKPPNIAFLSIASALLSFMGPALAADRSGARDFPLLKRYEGSTIFQHSQEAYARYPLALGKALNPSVPASQGRTIEKEEKIEGRLTRISYVAPAISGMLCASPVLPSRITCDQPSCHSKFFFARSFGTKRYTP